MYVYLIKAHEMPQFMPNIWKSLFCQLDNWRSRYAYCTSTSTDQIKRKKREKEI